MPHDRDEVGPAQRPRHVHRHLPHALRGVDKEERPLGAAEGGRLRDGLQGAHLVVAVHDGDQRRLGAEGGGELGQPDEALAADAELLLKDWGYCGGGWKDRQFVPVRGSIRFKNEA